MDFGILNDAWAINLRKKEKSMNNNYELELEDLKKVYENAVKQIKGTYEHKIASLVAVMKDFVTVYESKKLYEAKLEVLDVKLNSESCDCCDDEDEENDE